MANFITEFNKGQKGSNKGLYMGEGLGYISKAINGIQRGMTYGIAAGPKVGKSTFVDYGFVIEPYLYALENKISANWIYFSFEMDRVAKEFDFMTYFIFKEYNIEIIELPTGVTVNGETEIPLSSNYLRGRIVDDNDEVVTVQEDIVKIVKDLYNSRIKPLFGTYNKEGKLQKKGVITFIDKKENPTGLRNLLISYAQERGEFVYEYFTDREGKENRKFVSYLPNNPNEYVFVITDTIRKLRKERNFDTKETIDKWLEYSTEIRNLCKYSFVHIVHLNRSTADINRLKFMGDLIFPTPEDIKDTGNLSEECNYLFTLFNPNDSKYNLDKHFDLKIRDDFKNPIYPNYRSAHLVESREVICPQHFRYEMYGNVKNFKQLKIK